jgi:hypothetical protein
MALLPKGLAPDDPNDTANDAPNDTANDMGRSGDGSHYDAPLQSPEPAPPSPDDETPRNTTVTMT